MLRFLVVLLGCILLPLSAHAYSIGKTNGASGQVLRWHSSNMGYYIYASGSADVLDGSDLAAVKNGFQQWSSIACSNLNVSFMGTTNNKYNMASGADTNGQNEVGWAEGSEWKYGAYVLGLTQTSFSPVSGEIFEADIAFNGYQNKWSTNGKSGTADVLNVASHEQGHFVGAQHVLGGYSSSNPPTMAPKADPYLKSQSLEADDKLLACYLYPKGEYNCSSNNDCPYVVDKNQFGEEAYVQKITCVNSLCGGVSAQIPEGEKVLGEDCASDFDCKNPYFCQPTGAGSVCAKNCNTDNDCGSGFKCFPYSNGGGGVCLPYTDTGGTPGATKAHGEQCNSSQECQSGLCVGGVGGTAYCRQSCNIGANNCPAGEACSQLEGSNYGACLPSSGSSGTKAPGESCASPYDCMSGLCVGLGNSYKCREPCEPSLGDCPEAYSCQALQGGGGACVPAAPTHNLGGDCQYNSDCDSDFCLSIVGSTTPAYCSQNCAGPNDCPCGMKCSAFQGSISYCTIEGPQNCTPSGNPCGGSDECVSLTCVSGICRDLCEVGGKACAAGQACQRISSSSINGYCVGAGVNPPGSGCAQDSDCSTLLCMSLGGVTLCQQPCDPVSTFCGEAKACLQVSNTEFFVCGDAPVNADGNGTSGSGSSGSGSSGTDGGVDTGTNGSGSTGGTGVGTTGGSSTTGTGDVGVQPVESGGCSAGQGGAGRVAWLLLLTLMLLWRSKSSSPARQNDHSDLILLPRRRR